MKKSLLIISLSVGLSACGSNNDIAAKNAETDLVSESAPPAMTVAAETDTAAEAASNDVKVDDIPITIPKIAYIYEYGFRLPASKIPAAQLAHITMCEQRGPTVCRVLNLNNDSNEGEYAGASLQLAVATPQARLFSGELADAIKDHDGETISNTIQGEDLTKEIVDTEARLRSRELLSARLTEVLRTKNGSVDELIAAERGVTEINEEIDRVRNWLQEMRGRVAYSKVTLNYGSFSANGGGFTRPISTAFNSAVPILGRSFAAAVLFLSVTVPWALLIGGGIFMITWLRRRFSAAKPQN